MRDWIDVAIPGLAGLILIFAPESWLVRRTMDAAANDAQISRLRKIGVLLLIVAGVFKLASTLSKF
jgi:hypothetical protein